MCNSASLCTHLLIVNAHVNFSSPVSAYTTGGPPGCCYCCCNRGRNPFFFFFFFFLEFTSSESRASSYFKQHEKSIPVFPFFFFFTFAICLSFSLFFFKRNLIFRCYFYLCFIFIFSVRRFVTGIACCHLAPSVSRLPIYVRRQREKRRRRQRKRGR